MSLAHKYLTKDDDNCEYCGVNRKGYLGNCRKCGAPLPEPICVYLGKYVYDVHDAYEVMMTGHALPIQRFVLENK